MKAFVLNDNGKTPRDGHAHQLFVRCNPPLDTRSTWPNGDEPVEYVISSAVTVFGKPETYLFRADESGKVTNWLELCGSQKGTLSHERVWEELGYELVREGDDQ